jgi:ribonuclease III
VKGVPEPAEPVADRWTSLEDRLGHAFDDRRLLERALTHRSAASDHNERLEFLGDAVLAHTVSAMLYERMADATEGDLTRIRAHLVREESLHRIAVALQLPEWIRLSDGEAKAGGAQRPSILADALEALFGAIFVDGGFVAASTLAQRLFGEQIDSGDGDAWRKDPKTELQEWLQARKYPVPQYRIVATTGQAHAQSFDVECSVQALSLESRGQGRSRRAAEQVAARAMLDELHRTQH